MNLKKFLPIIGILLLLYILSTVDIQKIITVFTSVNPFYAALSFLLLIPILLLVNYEWQLVLHTHKIKVSFWYSLKNIFIGYFYGFITPGGLGAYTRAIYLQEESGETLQKCVVNVLIFNTIDYLALLTLGVVGAFVLSSQYPRLFPLILLVFVIMFLLLVIFIRKETGQKLFQRLLRSRFLNPFQEKWSAHIDSLYEDIPKLWDLLPPFFVSFVGWFVWSSEFFVISKLFSFEIPYIDFIFIIAVANVIASIPITIYGLGTREVALIGLFSVYLVGPEQIMTLSLFWFAIILLFPSIIGAGVTLFESRKLKSSSNKKMSV